MPIRKRIGALRTQTVDPIRAFKLSATGLDPYFGPDRYATEPEARAAWQRARRAVWAQEPCWRIPGPAEVYDGLTCHTFAAMALADCSLQFDASRVLPAIAQDRAALATFRAQQPKAAGSIADYLDVWTAFLDRAEHEAHAQHGLDLMARRGFVRPEHWQRGTYADAVRRSQGEAS